MSADDLKSLALKYCIDIYIDYEEDEVIKFAPTSVQKAWKCGRDYMVAEREADAINRKDFVL